MSLANLPDELIAHMSFYLSYSDTMRLMETNKKYYRAIKRYGKSMLLADLPYGLIDQISSYLTYSDIRSLMATNKTSHSTIKRLSRDKVWLTNLNISEDMDPESDRLVHGAGGACRYSFKDFDTIDDDVVKIKKILEQTITSEICNVLLETKANIRSIQIETNRSMVISVSEMLQLCEKFKTMSYFFIEWNHGIWNDEIVHERGFDRIYWLLGILQPDQAEDVEIYFGENGQLGHICRLQRFPRTNVDVNMSYIVESHQRNQFTVYFQVALPTIIRKKPPKKVCSLS